MCDGAHDFWPAFTTASTPLRTIGVSTIAQAWRGFCASSAGLAELPPDFDSLWKRLPCWLTQM